MRSVRIPLNSSKYPNQSTLIDEDDLEIVSSYALYVSVGRNTLYVGAFKKVDGEHVYTRLHRVLMNPPAGMHVDHINKDGLDNRRSNLRLVTPLQNICNSRVRKDSVSGFKGVHRRRGKKGRWAAYIILRGRKTHIGMFDTAEEAARAYDRAARQERGEFAGLNFPENEP